MLELRDRGEEKRKEETYFQKDDVLGDKTDVCVPVTSIVVRVHRHQADS